MLWPVAAFNQEKVLVISSQPFVSSSSGKLKLISHRINIFPQITIFCEINTHPLQLGRAGASHQAPAPFYAATN